MADVMNDNLLALFKDVNLVEAAYVKAMLRFDGTCRIVRGRGGVQVKDLLNAGPTFYVAWIDAD